MPTKRKKKSAGKTGATKRKVKGQKSAKSAKRVKEFQVEIGGKSLEFFIAEISTSQLKKLRGTGLRVSGTAPDQLSDDLKGMWGTGLLSDDESAYARINDDEVTLSVKKQKFLTVYNFEKPKTDLLISELVEDCQSFSGVVEAERQSDIVAALVPTIIAKMPKGVSDIEVWAPLVQEPEEVELEFDGGSGGDYNLTYVTKNGEVFDIEVDYDDESGAAVLGLC